MDLSSIHKQNTRNYGIGSGRILKESEINDITDKLLVRSIDAVLLGARNPGRLKNLLDRLTELTEIPNFHPSEILRVSKKVDAFSEATGWHKKEKHVITLISFCVTLAEEKNMNPKIVQCLADLYEFINRGGETPSSCLWAGEQAFVKWENIKKEQTH